MDTKKLITEFRYIISTSGGIKNLREIIFSLAVNGHLVPQNHKEESALEFLKTSWNEIEHMNANWKSKYQETSEKEIAFKLPTNWNLLPVRLLGKISNGNSISETDRALKYSKVKEGLPFISTKDVGYGRDKLVYNNGVKIPFNEPKFKVAPARSVLICSEGGSAGKKIGITEQEICFGNKLFALTTFNGLIPEYALLVYQSPIFFVQFKNRMTGIIGGISINQFKEILIPVPPPSEQLRIVAKVNELIALCDKLEAQQQEHDSIGKAFRKASLGHLTIAQNSNALRSAWERVRNNISIWLNDEDAIVEMRNTVGFLGCHGLLTESNPFYSTELNISVSPLPTGWSWTTVKQLSEYITSGSRGWKKFMASQGDIFIRSQDIKQDSLVFEDKVFVDLPDQVEGMRTLVRQGDLLMTITGANVGKCAQVPLLTKKAYVSQHVALIRVKDISHTPFLHWWITNTYGGRKHLAQYIYGDKPGLNLAQVGCIPIPLPPQEVQDRIVESLENYKILFDRLASQVRESRHLSKLLATAAIASITGIQIEDKEKMKMPKTELVSTLRIGVSPTNREQAPLAAILIRHNGEMPAKTLWQASGLEIDAFYQSLKTEMARGWIVQPEIAYMKEVEVG